MSHNPERADKNCLNCGTTVAGRYCQHCGQENVETRETFWSLAKHFVFDVLHFDGKFFYTLKYLFTKPGFVAKQYVEGKRAAYLHPIRMYLFTSAVFFLVFFSVGAIKVGEGDFGRFADSGDRRGLAKFYQEKMAKNPADTVLKPRIALLLDTSRRLPYDSLNWLRETQTIMKTNGRLYSSLANYDSVQAALPANQKDNLFNRAFTRQTFKSAAKYGNDPEGRKTFFELLIHRLPYLLFFSLPFFAGILKLLYTRRKNFLYSDHAVFTLYHYVFSFLLLLLIIGVASLRKASGWEPVSYVARLLGLAWPVYLFIEMKRFYGQGAGKVFLKFLLLNLLGCVVILLLSLVFVLISFFQS